ncbi:MAG: hypothetical protein U0893_21990 [Chloroflexota bacterium]
MAYEIWEMQTGNLVASFRREREALALVRDALEAHGDTYVRSLALVREDEDGSTITVAESCALIERARVPA